MVKQAKHAAGTKSEPPIIAALERYFGLKAQGTDIRTEFIAGVTTFLTMVYIAVSYTHLTLPTNREV